MSAPYHTMHTHASPTRYYGNSVQNRTTTSPSDLAKCYIERRVDVETHQLFLDSIVKTRHQYAKSFWGKNRTKGGVGGYVYPRSLRSKRCKKRPPSPVGVPDQRWRRAKYQSRKRSIWWKRMTSNSLDHAVTAVGTFSTAVSAVSSVVSA